MTLWRTKSATNKMLPDIDHILEKMCMGLSYIISYPAMATLQHALKVRLLAHTCNLYVSNHT